MLVGWGNLRTAGYDSKGATTRACNLIYVIPCQTTGQFRCPVGREPGMPSYSLKKTAASAKALPHLTLFCYKDCQLVEITAGRLADDKGLHCWVTNAVHIQSERPHSCSHHAIPVAVSQSHSGNSPTKFTINKPRL